MATKKVSAYNVHSVYGAKFKQSLAAVLLEGTFVALETGTGLLIPADFRASQGRQPARGCLLQGCQRKDMFGNVIATEVMGSYTREGKLANVTAGGPLLQAGQSYYLSSGGGIQLAKPGTTGDLAQFVGYAEDSTTLVIAVGSPTIQ